MKEKKALTTGEVAKYCGVHFRTVTRWIQRGHLKAFKLPGRGDSRIFVQDFVEFLKSNNIDVPADLVAKPAGMRALVVEDDPVMARTIKRTLSALGFECETAGDGFRAGAMLNSWRPDLVTLDLGMPGLSGTGVLEIVRALDHGKKIKVLVISGQEGAQIKKATAAGADGMLKKPFTKDELVSKIRELTGL